MFASKSSGTRRPECCPRRGGRQPLGSNGWRDFLQSPSLLMGTRKERVRMDSLSLLLHNNSILQILIRMPKPRRLGHNDEHSRSKPTRINFFRGRVRHTYSFCESHCERLLISTCDSICAESYHSRRRRNPQSGYLRSFFYVLDHLIESVELFLMLFCSLVSKLRAQ